ncbi:uncharacterized protein N0V89_005920 [Didymosphaeria variabile]|uniref:Uncharacterized protein n=1 Tax=Didymosphaeria variabile TaxID=1932322 RepID=A0A9W9CBN5_9PLEO|nr:uncharacterized protein N0V89_005920 [Didymosphaeria variabile]KAJ4354187.1 hypothetical protein N0V89_005920 [Didymosphaeria variabile]
MQRQPHPPAHGQPISSAVSITPTTSNPAYIHPTDFDEQLDGIIANPNFLASSEWLNRHGYVSAAQYALEAVAQTVFHEFQGGDDFWGTEEVVETEVGNLYRHREDSAMAEEPVTLQYPSSAASQYDPLLQYDPLVKSSYSFPVSYQNPSLMPWQYNTLLQYNPPTTSHAAPPVSSQNISTSASPYAPRGASSYSGYAPAASPYTSRADSPYAGYAPAATSRAASPYPGYASATSPNTPRAMPPYHGYAPAAASQHSSPDESQTVDPPALQYNTLAALQPAPKANEASFKANSTPTSAVRTQSTIPTDLKNITRGIEKKPTQDLYQAALDIKQQIYDWHAERDLLEDVMLAKKQEHNTRLKNAAKSQSGKESLPCPEERERRKKLMDKIRGFQKKFETVNAELEKRGVVVPV